MFEDGFIHIDHIILVAGLMLLFYLFVRLFGEE